MEIMNGVTVIAITVICYLVVEGIKQTRLNNKWLPTIAGFVGGALGVVGFYVIKDFPATDIISAIAVGIESGLAAVGVNQIYKQLTTKE